LKDRGRIIKHFKKNIYPIIDDSIDKQDKLVIGKMESEIRYPPSTSENIIRIKKMMMMLITQFQLHLFLFEQIQY